ncbi:hypothetical protein [Marinilabilia salmonicolor]|uniref:Uncharacterized protein n=1 Tax=Marinilabilia salmonicolor TaxID=989 RepID=A0A368VF58_9BACT|nr:hypothetical protein [Marinilabilia salmonicolor]RCW38865.1 hypothetical protein DFO77_10219 [Marinilabilia salmonicolor]
MAKSIFDKLSDESVVNQIRKQSESHLEHIQRENRKGSGRKKAECAPHLQKYYADGPGNDVVQVSKELKKALNLKKIETGKPVKLLVAEAIVEYLGIE